MKENEKELVAVEIDEQKKVEEETFLDSKAFTTILVVAIPTVIVIGYSVVSHLLKGIF